MGPLPLLRAEDSLLLIIDMQTGSGADTPPEAWTAARDCATALTRAAAALSLPVFTTRQQPAEWGDLDPQLAAVLPGYAECLDHGAFAATAEPTIAEALAMAGRRQVVVNGMEAHIAVLQTVAGLAELGYAPFVVADGICARDPVRARGAMARMQAAGIPNIDGESVLCEWLREPGHPQFAALANANT